MQRKNTHNGGRGWKCCVEHVAVALRLNMGLLIEGVGV